MLIVFVINPSMMNYVDFRCNSFTIGCGENTLMHGTNWQLCDKPHQHKVVRVCNYNVPNLQMTTR